jgi:hypothetical protein
MKKYFIIALSLLSFQSLAAEKDIILKDGPGKEIVETKCSICHSVDMIQINSPFMNQKEWTATVNKMVHVMGAPLDAEQIPVAIEYLTKNYGK